MLFDPDNRIVPSMWPVGCEILNVCMNQQYKNILVQKCALLAQIAFLFTAFGKFRISLRGCHRCLIHESFPNSGGIWFHGNRPSSQFTARIGTIQQNLPEARKL